MVPGRDEMAGNDGLKERVEALEGEVAQLKASNTLLTEALAGCCDTITALEACQAKAEKTLKRLRWMHGK